MSASPMIGGEHSQSQGASHRRGSSW